MQGSLQCYKNRNNFLLILTPQYNLSVLCLLTSMAYFKVHSLIANLCSGKRNSAMINKILFCQMASLNGVIRRL